MVLLMWLLRLSTVLKVFYAVGVVVSASIDIADADWLVVDGIDVANAGIIIDGVVHATNGSVVVDVVFATFDVNVAALDMLAGLL